MLTTDISRFTTFLSALVVGGMEIMQPAAASLTARIDLGSVSIEPFQRRQAGGAAIPLVPGCDICNPIIDIVANNSCPPAECCVASFEYEYFNCFVCIATSVDLTDYTQPQSNVDQLYNECANLGLQLPVLTFPGQSLNRPLSSVAPPPSSQTTISNITFAPLPSVIQTVPLTSPATASTQASLPTSSSSSGIRSVNTSCFDLTAGAMTLGLLLCLVVQ